MTLASALSMFDEKFGDYSSNPRFNLQLSDVKSFITSVYASAREERTREVETILDGHKEVYTSGGNAGKDKEHEDSCCNETIDDCLTDIKNKLV